MSRLVWAATAIYAVSAAACLAYIAWELRRAKVIRPANPYDPDDPVWAELRARAAAEFAEDVVADIMRLPGSNEALGSDKP